MAVSHRSVHGVVAVVVDTWATACVVGQMMDVVETIVVVIADFELVGDTSWPGGCRGHICNSACRVPDSSEAHVIGRSSDTLGSQSSTLVAEP